MQKPADDLDSFLDALLDDGDEAAAPAAPSSRVVPVPASGTAHTLAPVISLDEVRARKELLQAEALSTALDALRVIAQAFKENGADFDDACKALPLVHRVLEHVDKMEVAAKSPTAWLPINFVIDMRPDATQAPPPRRLPAAAFAADVIDFDLVPDAPSEAPGGRG